MKPSLNNAWGRELGNTLRNYLNLPPAGAGESGTFNMLIGEDDYLLSLEAAAEEDVALLSLFRKVERFSVGRRLQALLEEVSISRYLPAPVHVALKPPETLVIMTRIHKQDAHRSIRLLDMLFSIYQKLEEGG